MKPCQRLVQVHNALYRNSIKTGGLSSSFCVDRACAHLSSKITGQNTVYYVEAVSQTPTNLTCSSDWSTRRGTRQTTAMKLILNERGRINTLNKTETSSVR